MAKTSKKGKKKTNINSNKKVKSTRHQPNIVIV